MPEPTGENALDQAVKRLDAALSQLEKRVGKPSDDGLFAQDSAKLAAALDQARAREKDLEVAGAEASAALGRAIAEIKSALYAQEEA